MTTRGLWVDGTWMGCPIPLPGRGMQQDADDHKPTNTNKHRHLGAVVTTANARWTPFTPFSEHPPRPPPQTRRPLQRKGRRQWASPLSSVLSTVATPTSPPSSSPTAPTPPSLSLEHTKKQTGYHGHVWDSRPTRGTRRSRGGGERHLERHLSPRRVPRPVRGVIPLRRSLEPFKAWSSFIEFNRTKQDVVAAAGRRVLGICHCPVGHGRVPVHLYSFRSGSRLCTRSGWSPPLRWL